MAKQFSTVVVWFKKLPELYNTPEFFTLPEPEKEYILRAELQCRRMKVLSWDPRSPLSRKFQKERNASPSLPSWVCYANVYSVYIWGTKDDYNH
jgi:hypothetical protein